MIHAGCYAGTLHFLKAISDIGVAAAKKSGSAIVDRMKKMPTDDDCFGKNTIREDGLLLCPAYLFTVKTPAESKGQWDYYKTTVTTPADQAWKPLAEEGCYFVKA